MHSTVKVIVYGIHMAIYLSKQNSKTLATDCHTLTVNIMIESSYLAQKVAHTRYTSRNDKRHKYRDTEVTTLQHNFCFLLQLFFDFW